MELIRRLAFATVVTALALGVGAGAVSAAPAGRLKPGQPPFPALPAVAPTGQRWIGAASGNETSPGSGLCQAFSDVTGAGGTCDPSSTEAIGASHVTQGPADPVSTAFQPTVVNGTATGTALVHDALGSCSVTTAAPTTGQGSAALLPPPGLVLYSGDAQVRMTVNPAPLTSALRVAIDTTAHTYQVFLSGLPVTIEATAPTPPAGSPCVGHVPTGFFQLTGDATVADMESDPQRLPRDPTRLVGSGSGTLQGVAGSLRGQVTMAWKLVDGASPPPVAVDDTARIHAGQTRLIDLLANDTGTVRRPRQVTQPACGSVLESGKDVFFQAPRSGCPGGVTIFTYVATDGVRRSAPATVTVIVTHPKHS